MLSKFGLACLSVMLVAIDSSKDAVGQAPSASGSATTKEFRQPVPAIRAEVPDPPLTFVDSFKHGLFGGITQVFITPNGKRCLSDASVDITTWVQTAGKRPLITGRDEILRVNVCRCDSSTGRLGRPDWFQHKSVARDTCMALFADGRYLVAVSKRKPQFMTLHIPLPTVVSESEPSRAGRSPTLPVSRPLRYRPMASMPISRPSIFPKRATSPHLSGWERSRSSRDRATNPCSRVRPSTANTTAWTTWPVSTAVPTDTG